MRPFFAFFRKHFSRWWKARVVWKFQTLIPPKQKKIQQQHMNEWNIFTWWSEPSWFNASRDELIFVLPAMFFLTLDDGNVELLRTDACALIFPRFLIFGFIDDDEAIWWWWCLCFWIVADDVLVEFVKLICVDVETDTGSFDCDKEFVDAESWKDRGNSEEENKSLIQKVGWGSSLISSLSSMWVRFIQWGIEIETEQKSETDELQFWADKSTQ